MEDHEKERIINESERFMREHIPSSREEKNYLIHVSGVREYSLLLAKKYDADEFVIEVAALLHDIGADAGKEHPLEGGKIAKEFLAKLNIPVEIGERIIKCIENHSMGSEVDNEEQQIIQDADGLSFLRDMFMVFFENQKQKGLPLDEAREVAIDKLKEMRKKIKTQEGIRLADEFYEKDLKVLESA